MQTITVKYLSPTDFRGARVKATTTGGDSLIIGYDYALGFEGSAVEVAKQLKAKLNWTGSMVGGHIKDGLVFVFNDKELTI